MWGPEGGLGNTRAGLLKARIVDSSGQTHPGILLKMQVVWPLF